MAFSPYLYFDGQCEEAFRYHEKCLGGKIVFMMTWEGSPMPGQARCSRAAVGAGERRRQADMNEQPRHEAAWIRLLTGAALTVRFAVAVV